MNKIREFGEYFINGFIIAGLPSWLIVSVLNRANTDWNIPYWVVLVSIGIAIGYQYGIEAKSIK